MADRSNFANPFYVLLLVVGAAFALTACAYGAMTVRNLDPLRGAADPSGEGWLRWIDQHGAALMLGEVAILAVATLAAIVTDDFWRRRAERRKAPSPASGDSGRNHS